MSKKRSYIPQLRKVTAQLQQEIESNCPFCQNLDVGHFQIHHIDEDPSNNLIENLLLLCPNCHSKITKKDISKQEVINKKMHLVNKLFNVEFISVSVDKENCGWRPIKGIKNAFELKYVQSFFPIFNFSFINNSEKTLLLTNIRLHVNHLPIGMAGPETELPKVLRSSVKYKIKMPSKDQTKTIVLDDELEIPTQRAFKFQIELYGESMKQFSPLGLRCATYFEFGFNNDFYVDAPMILLNSSTYYEQLEIVAMY